MTEEETNIEGLHDEASLVNQEIQEKKSDNENVTDQELADQIIKEREHGLVSNIRRLSDSAKARVQRERINLPALAQGEEKQKLSQEPREKVTLEDQLSKRTGAKKKWVRDISLGMALNDAGIKDKEQRAKALAVIDFISENVPGNFYRKIRVSRGKEAGASWKSKKQGWDVFGRTEYDNGTVELDLKKTGPSPLKPGVYELQDKIYPLLSKVQDPVRALSLLNNISDLTQQELLGPYNKDYINAVKDPKFTHALEILEKAGAKIRLGDGVQLEYLDLPEKIDESEEVLGRIARVSDIMEGRIRPSELKYLFSLSQESLHLLEILSVRPEFKRFNNVLRALAHFQENQLTQRVIFCLEQGIKVPYFLDHGIEESPYIEISDYQHKGITEFFGGETFTELNSDPELLAFLQTFQRINHDVTNFSSIREIYKKYDPDTVLAILEAIKETELFKSLDSQGSIELVVNDPVILGILLSEGFIEFSKQMVQNCGLSKNSERVTDYTHDISSSFAIFRDSELKDFVLSEEGGRILRLFGTLPRTSEAVRDLKDISSSAELTELLEEVKQIEIYCWADGKLFGNLTELSHDGRTLALVREKDFPSFLETLKSYYSLPALGSDGFRNALGFYEDPELRQSFQSETNRDLIGSLGTINEFTPVQMKDILALDETERSYYKAFHNLYGFTLNHYDGISQVISKLQELLSDQEKVKLLLDEDRARALKRHFYSNFIAAAAYAEVPVAVLDFVTESGVIMWDEEKSSYHSGSYSTPEQFKKLVELLSENEQIISSVRTILENFRQTKLVKVDTRALLIELVEYVLANPGTNLTNLEKIQQISALRDSQRLTIWATKENFKRIDEIDDNVLEEVKEIQAKTKINLGYLNLELLSFYSRNHAKIIEFCNLLGNAGIELEESTTGVNLDELGPVLQHPVKSVEKYVMLFGKSPFSFSKLYGQSIVAMVRENIDHQELADLLAANPDAKADGILGLYFSKLVGASTQETSVILRFFYSKNIAATYLKGGLDIASLREMYDAGLFQSNDVALLVAEHIGQKDLLIEYFKSTQNLQGYARTFLTDVMAVRMVVQWPEARDSLFKLSGFASEANSPILYDNASVLSELEDAVIPQAISLAAELNQMGIKESFYLRQIEDNPNLFGRVKELIELDKRSSSGKRVLLESVEIWRFIANNDDFASQLEGLNIPDDPDLTRAFVSGLSREAALGLTNEFTGGMDEGQLRVCFKLINLSGNEGMQSFKLITENSKLPAGVILEQMLADREMSPDAKQRLMGLKDSKFLKEGRLTRRHIFNFIIDQCPDGKASDNLELIAGKLTGAKDDAKRLERIQRLLVMMRAQDVTVSIQGQTLNDVREKLLGDFQTSIIDKFGLTLTSREKLTEEVVASNEFLMISELLASYSNNPAAKQDLARLLDWFLEGRLSAERYSLAITENKEIFSFIPELDQERIIKGWQENLSADEGEVSKEGPEASDQLSLFRAESDESLREHLPEAITIGGEEFNNSDEQLKLLADSRDVLLAEIKQGAPEKEKWIQNKDVYDRLVKIIEGFRAISGITSDTPEEQRLGETVSALNQNVKALRKLTMKNVEHIEGMPLIEIKDLQEVENDIIAMLAFLEGKLIDITRVVYEEADDLESLLKIGNEPVQSCQATKGGSHNYGLMGILSGVRKTFWANEGTQPLARVITRLMGYRESDVIRPILIVDRVYSVGEIDIITRGFAYLAFKKARSMNIPVGFNNSSLNATSLMGLAQEFSYESSAGEDASRGSELYYPKLKSTTDYFDGIGGDQTRDNSGVLIRHPFTVFVPKK